jgi:nucleoside-diphosphate kinase
MIQRTLVLFKPDAVQRGIVGEILHRFERAGLKIAGAKFFIPDKKKVADHYKKDDEWAKKVGNHRLEDAKKHNLDLKEIYGTDDLVKIGHMVNESNFDYLTMGPVLGAVLEGVNAVDKVKTMVGHTFSSDATPGTIRGDYSLESPLTSLIRKRTIYNIIHASGTIEEAEDEVKMWFDEDELYDYKRAEDSLYSY